MNLVCNPSEHAIDLILLLVSSTNAFMPQPSRAVAWAVDQLTSHTDKMRDEISHELFEELGMEIKPHIVHEEKGFGDLPRKMHLFRLELKNWTRALLKEDKSNKSSKIRDFIILDCNK